MIKEGKEVYYYFKLYEINNNHYSMYTKND